MADFGKNFKNLIVVAGPSGSGKSTLINKLLKEHPDKFGFSISHTIRKPRLGEINGKDYYFVTKEEIQKDIQNNKFIETANYSGNIYGTSYSSVENVLNQGKACVLDVDVEGVKQIKKRKDLNPIFIFVKPPSMEVLKERLQARGEFDTSLENRLSLAKGELVYGEIKGNFNFVIINDDVQKSYRLFESFIIEELKKRGAQFKNIKNGKGINKFLRVNN